MKERRLFAPYLFLLPIAVMLFSCVLVSCKKDTATTSIGSNVDLLINNLSPDAGSVQLYLNNVIQNQLNTTTTGATPNYASYTYNSPSAYFSLKSSSGLPQLRSASSVGTIFITVDTGTLQSNHKYSLFLTGLYSANTLKYIFTEDDSTKLPAVGRGKIRYINATLNTTLGYDVYANGTLAFKNILYTPSKTSKSVSPYVELPAGTYDFKFVYNGNDVNQTANILLDIPNVTIGDGHLYTLYTGGISGGVDTAAVTGTVITNQ